MTLQNILAPASNAKSDCEIGTKPLIRSPKVDQGHGSVGLAALFEENTLAKIIGSAEAYLENNVGTVICEIKIPLSNSKLLEPSNSVSRDSASDWSEQGCVQM
jgi:hypothetical protein